MTKLSGVIAKFRVSKLTTGLLLVIISMFAFSSSGHAVPAFARQMGMDCLTCHFHQFPLLNAFGREFKASGYTMVGKQAMIEGERLSIPEDLNLSLVTKVRYQKTNGDDDTEATNHGELQFPDEAAFLIGGRASENVGVLVEFATFGKAATKGIGTGLDTATEGGEIKEDAEVTAFSSYRMPIVYDVAGTKLSVIPYTTDALGASFGFELLNTGAVRNVRITEHRGEVSAQQYLGTDGAATGIAFVAYHDTGYVNYSLWKPVHGNSSASFLNYLRIATTHQVAGWDVGGGAQLWSGTSKDETNNNNETANAWAVDAQAQGSVNDMPLGVYLTYGSVSSGTTLFKADSKATVLAADLGILPYTQVSAALRLADTNGNSDNSIALGAKYLLAQNVQLSLNHAIYSGDKYDPKPATGDQLTTLMVFAAF